jgi:hypothetical protein
LTKQTRCPYYHGCGTFRGLLRCFDRNLTLQQAKERFHFHFPKGCDSQNLFWTRVRRKTQKCFDHR